MFENALIPKWSRFLLVDDNKIELSLFLSEVFEGNAQKSISNNQRLILTGSYRNSTTTKINQNDLISEAIHFQSNHLEADCRMIFMAHIMHSELEKKKTKGMITLYSVETDVLALVYYHSIFFQICRCVL